MENNTTIRAGELELEVSPNGAEMQSLRLNGQEYLWQGDPQYWRNRAPNLFPYIARLTNNNYTYKGNTYGMNIHGFIKDSLLTPKVAAENSVTFTYTSTPQTLAQYPFPFHYSVTYTLIQNTLHIEYQVENLANEPLYFGVGGHPGFILPILQQGNFNDYYLEFSQPAAPQRILFSANNLVAGKEPFPLKEEKYLPLEHSLFDNDAIVLEGAAPTVTIKSDKYPSYVRVEAPDFAYLGFWTMPKKSAPYLCVEPWSSLPSREGIVEDLTTQPSLITLKEKSTYTARWSITIG